MVVYADIGGVYFGLQHRLHQCICRPYSNIFQNCVKKQFLCLKTSIFRCLMFHNPRASPRYVTRPVCGVINTGNQLMAHTWHIAVPSMFSLYINFLQFNLPMTPNCKFGNKVTVETANNNTKQKMLTYCGHRIPWHLSFLQSHATVKCDTGPTTHEGFLFVMTFQAFDITLATIVLTQLNQIELYETDYYVRSIGDRIKTKHGRNFTLTYLGPGQESSFIETEVRIHITVMVFWRIILQSSPERFSQITIYNGPGRLSPVIVPSPRSSRLELDSYQAYITYSVMSTGSITDIYNEANNRSSSNMSSLSWGSEEKRDRRSVYCSKRSSHIHYLKYVKMHISSTYYSTFAICPHDFSFIVTIHSMTFTGFNMQFHNPSSISLFDTCQYGGLFVLKENGTEYLKLCTDVHASFTFPFNGFWPEAGGGGKIVFATFQGYSRGSIYLTSVRDLECTGLNIEISRGPSCNNYLTSWDDLYWNEYLLGFPHTRIQNNCTDVWLMNDIDYFDSSPFENCSFVFDPIQSAFVVGSVKMTTGASTSYINSSTLLGDIMHVAMNTFTDANPKTTTKKYFSVHLKTQNEYKFYSIGDMAFKINFSIYDELPVFAIRIKFQRLSEMICAEKLTPKLISRIENGNSDVYLPRDHPHEHHAYQLDHSSGYNRGICRVHIVDQICSFLVPNYQIIRIHYYPRKSVISPHEVDISLKKTLNCSIKCSLDVGILEYIIDTNGKMKSRYHEWRGIYRLTWQIIPAKSRGFSVTINSTCQACTKLCEVAVALGLPLKTNQRHGLNGSDKYYNLPYLDVLEVADKIRNWLKYDTFERILFNLTRPEQRLILRNAVYGSWNDAQTYCLSQNSSLATLTPHLSRQLKSLALEYGWKYPHERFFCWSAS